MSKKRRLRRTERKRVEVSPTTGTSRLTWGVVVGALILLDVLVFGQVVHHERTNFDDNVYVWGNERVQRGLTLDGIRWAFTTFHFANWHPLTWLSHMLDCQLFGLRVGGHLATNVALHTASAILLLLGLERMTRAFWPSAAVATLFAIHPIHVESVAWVAERKDVLSGLFWMLTLLLYARYAREPSSWKWYGAVVLSFALGLMAKPMLVTLPFVLLLLDLWPLGRLSLTGGRDSVGALVREKVPLFVLTAGASAMTFLAQKQAGAVQSVTRYPLPVRLANGVISYGSYVFMTLWPARLAAYYPYPHVVPIGKLSAAAALFLGVSAWSVACVRTRPYLLVGWLWYVGTLVPVIGIVQVGAQAMADRYTYVPAVGLFIAICFGIAELVRARPGLGSAVTIGSSLVLLLFALLARAQVEVWHDMLTLFSHAVEVTSENQLAQCSLADALRDRGRPQEAVPHYLEAIRIAPDYFEAHNNLASVLADLGRGAEAVEHFEAALAIKPDSALACSNFGNTLRTLRRYDEANRQFARALELDPSCVDARYNWGLSLTEEGHPQEAVARYREVIAARPDHLNARLALGVTLQREGKSQDAIGVFQEAVRLQPDNGEAHADLGNALITAGRASEATSELRRATELRPGDAGALNNLGVALFQQGRYAEAVDVFDRLVRMKPEDAAAKASLDTARQKAAALSLSATP